MRSKANIIQFLTYAGIFSSSIFIPLLCKDMGGSAFDVGLVVSLYYFAFLVSSYIFGIATDKGHIKLFLRTGLVLCSAMFAAQIFIVNLESLFFLRILSGFALGIYPAALSVYAYRERGGKMGKFIGFGSLGWAAASITAAVTGSYKILFITSAILFFITFLVSAKFKPVKTEININFFPWHVIKRNFRIYFEYFLRSLGAQAVWSIFPLYLLGLGADKFWIGIIYFANTFTQFFIMREVEKYKNTFIIKLGLVFSVIAFYFFAIATHWVIAIPIQLLIAFSFGSLSVGVVQELLYQNKEKGTVIGILNSIVNFCAVIGPLFGGIIAYYFGYPALMYTAAVLSALAFFI